MLNRDETIALFKESLSRLSLSEPDLLEVNRYREFFDEKGKAIGDWSNEGLPGAVESLHERLVEMEGTLGISVLKEILLNVEGGLMTRAAMTREYLSRNTDNVHDRRGDVVAALRTKYYSS